MVTEDKNLGTVEQGVIVTNTLVNLYSSYVGIALFFQVCKPSVEEDHFKKA